MAYNDYTSKSDIFFSCTEKMHLDGEHFIPEHLLIHVHSGSMIVQGINEAFTIHAGENMLFARNQLARFTKVPNGNIPFKSITIFFSQSLLQKHYAINTKIKEGNKPVWALQLGKHPLLDSLANSISSYYEFEEKLPEDLVDLKLTEALTIIRKINKSTDAILFDFSEPGKIDISDFMLKNYSFNIPLARFAYLTGRSLATFKRDFQKSFFMPPQKWLHQKRLEEARFLIVQKKQKPSDVYLEVGFENLSHFSNSFKQMFGYSPSSLS